MPEITLTIMSPGDRSVGIPDWNLDILLGDHTMDEERREDIRKAGVEFGKVLVGEPCYGIFSDECPDCRAILNDGKCSQESCINNLPTQELSGDTIRKLKLLNALGQTTILFTDRWQCATIGIEIYENGFRTTSLGLGKTIEEAVNDQFNTLAYLKKGEYIITSQGNFLWNGSKFVKRREKT